MSSTLSQSLSLASPPVSLESFPSPETFLVWFQECLDASSGSAAVESPAFLEALRSRPVLLFGAGVLGQKVAQALEAEGLSPKAFLVDEMYVEKTRRALPQATVMTPEAAALDQAENAVVLVCVCHDKHRFEDTQTRFEALGFKTVETFLRLASCLPEDNALFPYYQFTAPGQLRGQAERLQRIYARLVDDTSRRQFCQQLVFRLTWTHHVLPQAPEYTLYFPEPVLKALPERVVFVDGGTFNGQTTLDAWTQLGGRFVGARCFEPDASNYERVLQRFQVALPESLQAQVLCERAAISAENGHMAFDCQGTEGSHLTPTGSQLVDVRALDTALADVSEALYIKLDLEGAEQDALRGARTLLRDRAPALAICAYHRPDDLWVLPEMIFEAQPDYQLFYRIEGEDGLGAVYYALPPVSSNSEPRVRG